jgi:hypothetical protein
MTVIDVDSGQARLESVALARAQPAEVNSMRARIASRSPA